MTKLLLARTNVREAGSCGPSRVARTPAALVTTVSVLAVAALALPFVLLPFVLAAAVSLGGLLVVAAGARRTVGELLAGLTLHIVQPYSPGERIRILSAGGVVDAEVVHVGLLSTSLCSDAGLISVPNSNLLRVPLSS